MLNTLLKDVMTQGYMYVEEHQSVGKALGMMRDMRISSVFVVNRDKPLGIVTERKVMEWAVKGNNLFTAKVMDIMSTPLITLSQGDTISDAVDLMLEKRIRHIGIIENSGSLRGCVTPANIVNLMGSDSFSSTARVRDVMSDLLVSLPEEGTLYQAASALLESRSCCVVVMDNNYPVGVVSEKDITRCAGYGHDLRRTTVTRIMSKPLIGIDEMDTIAQAIITLRRHLIHRLVVYNVNNKVSGILSLYDLTRNLKSILPP